MHIIISHLKKAKITNLKLEIESFLLRIYLCSVFLFMSILITIIHLSCVQSTHCRIQIIVLNKTWMYPSIPFSVTAQH